MRYLILFLAISLLLLAACSDRVPAPATPALSPGATASLDPSITPVPVDLPSLTLAPAVALPADVALLLETGCFQCDGSATGLIRVTRSATGVAGRDLLLSAGAHSLYGEGTAEALYFAGDLPIPRNIITTSKDLHQYDPYVTGIATSGDGSEIVVSVCVYPGCGVGMDAWSEKGRVALYRSTDGGNTWADFGTIAGGGVLGVTDPGEVLAHSPTGADGPPDIFIYPERALLTHPETASGVLVFPSVLPDGTIAWRDGAGTVKRTDGSLILQMPELPGVVGPYSIDLVTQQPFERQLIAVEWAAASRPGAAAFLSLFDANGIHQRTVGLDRRLYAAGWISDSALIASVDVRYEELSPPPPVSYPGLIPALIDIEVGTISPIVDPFLEPGAEMGRNYVRGVQLAHPSR